MSKKTLHKRADVLKCGKTKAWLKARAAQKASATYLHSPEKIKQNEFMDNLFAKFDMDGSGTLDMMEMLELFHDNKIYLKFD